MVPLPGLLSLTSFVPAGRRRRRRGVRRVGLEVARRRRAVGDRGVLAVEVGVHDRQDEVDVGVAVVVAVDRRTLAGRGREVVLAGAEVDRRGQGRVVDVLRVALAVAVGVHAHDRPGRGDELHRTDRAVPHGVAVELTGVGVGDGLGLAGAVEGDAEDAGTGDALVVEGVAAVAAVVGLDPADRRDQLAR